MHAAASQSSYAYQTLPFMLMFALFQQNASTTAAQQQQQRKAMAAALGQHQQQGGIVSQYSPLYGIEKGQVGTSYDSEMTSVMRDLLEKLVSNQDRRIRPNFGSK